MYWQRGDTGDLGGLSVGVVMLGEFPYVGQARLVECLARLRTHLEFDKDGIGVAVGFPRTSLSRPLIIATLPLVAAGSGCSYDV